MKNNSAVPVRFQHLPFWRFAVVVCAAVCIHQTQALDRPQPQIKIETRYLEASSSLRYEIGTNLGLGARYPGFGAPVTFAYKPIAVLPQADVVRVLDQIQKNGGSTVMTSPIVNALPGQTATIRGGGIGLRVVPVYKPDGSVYMTIESEEVLVPPGDTLLIGKKLSPKLDQLVFLKPQIIGGFASPTLNQPIVSPVQGAFMPQTYNWTGLYVGVQTGYVRSSSDFTTMLNGRWNDFRDVASEIQSRGRHEFDEDGFGFGGCGGYDYEFGNHVVLGGAVTGRRFWDLCDSFHTGDFQADDEGLFDVRSSFRTTYLVTAGPRIGYACGRFLPYVTGGVAFGEVDASQKIFSNEFIPRQGGRESDIQTGWTVGTGVQYAITNNLSLKWEYRYTDLGTLDFSSKGADPFRDFTGWHSASLTEHSFNAGVVLTFH